MAALNEIASTVALNAIDIPALASIVDEPNIGTSPLGRTDGHRDVRSAANYDSPGSARFHRTRALRRRTAFRHVVSSDAVRGGDTLAAPRCRAGGTGRIVSPLSDHERETLKALLARVIEANSSRTKD